MKVCRLEHDSFLFVASIMLFHHCLSIFGLVNTAFQCKWGTELVGVVALAEVTNPLLQIRWFLKDQGYSKTIIGEIVDFLFIVVFGVCRLGIGGYVLVGYMSHPNDDILGRIGALSIFTVSIIFYYYILGYAYKKYSRLFFNTNKSNGSHNGVPTHAINNGQQHGAQSSAHIKTE